MPKIIINRSYGGYCIHEEAINLYKKLKNLPIEEAIYYHNIERTDPVLIQVVETLGDKASCGSSELKIVTVPDDVKWEIEDYGGMERVVEEHRVWC